MFRIQKAVEKAKQKRADMAGTAPEHSSPLERISYSNTRIVNVSNEVLERNRLLASAPHDPCGQLFRTLRTKIIRKMRQHGWNTLAVTSPSERDGKTLVACNLAIAMALEVNQTVLLMDLNLRNPGVARCFEIEPEHGLQDYLNGEVAFSDLMINPGIDRLVMIPGKGSAVNAAELISCPRMTALFQETKRRYKNRFVVYDVPAILATDDFLNAISHIDATLLVIGDGCNTEEEILQSKLLIENHNLIGTVVNKSSGSPYHDKSLSS